MRSVVRRQFLPLLLAAVLAGAAGCDSNNDTTTGGTTTTPTTTFQTTETFTGTLTTNGAASYSFTVTAAGTVYVTLTALSDSANPSATPPTVGLSLGTWNGTSCSVQTGIFTDTAAVNASIAGTVTGAGQLCARVYDAASRLTSPLSFTITVVHP